MVGGVFLPSPPLPPPLDQPLAVCLCCMCVQCVHFVINFVVDFLPLVWLMISDWSPSWVLIWLTQTRLPVTNAVCLFGCPDIVSLTEKFLMARNIFRIFTENNPVMGYSKTFFIPEAKGLRYNVICWTGEYWRHNLWGRGVEAYLHVFAVFGAILLIGQ